MATKIEWVGLVAAGLGILRFVPLALQVTFRKATHSLHYLWLVIGIVAAVMWLLYGLANHLLPNIIGSIAAMVVMVYLGIIKIYYESTGQASHQNNEKPVPVII